MRHRLVLPVSTLLVVALTILSGTFAWRKASTSGTRGAASDGASGASDAADGSDATVASGAALVGSSAGTPAWDGADAFRQQCAMCHEADDLARDLRSAQDPAGHVLRTLEFLEDHFTEDDAQRRAILRHVLDG